MRAWNRAGNNLNQSWILSEVGDWDSFTENGVTENRTHGDAHEVLSIAANNLVHDAKGNIVTNSHSHTYTWDADNHRQQPPFRTVRQQAPRERTVTPTMPSVAEFPKPLAATPRFMFV